MQAGWTGEYNLFLFLRLLSFVATPDTDQTPLTRVAADNLWTEGHCHTTQFTERVNFGWRFLELLYIGFFGQQPDSMLSSCIMRLFTHLRDLALWGGRAATQVSGAADLKSLAFVTPTQTSFYVDF